MKKKGRKTGILPVFAWAALLLVTGCSMAMDSKALSGGDGRSGSRSVLGNVSFLRAEGTRIVNLEGEEVHLRGINLGNWLLWEGYLMMGDFNYRTHSQFFDSVKEAFGGDLDKALEFEHQWRMNYVTENSIQELSDLGFNSVRVPFHYNMFWDWDSYSVRDYGFQYIDRLIEYCREYDMYILLDMHAAPGYQNPGDHSDNIDSDASQPRESVGFWDGDNIYIASQVWEHIASYYQDEPLIWGYDLINEPVPQPGREFELLRSLITLRDAIRQVDNNHIIVAEGSWWGSDMQKLDWMDGETQNITGVDYRWDDNLVYQTHHYSQDVSLLDGRLAVTDKLNVPLILGEYGEDDNNNLRNMTDWCLDNNVGYFPWSFKKMSHDRCLWTIPPNDSYNGLKDFINNGGTPPEGLYGDMIAFCEENIDNGSPDLIWHQGFYDAVKDDSLPFLPPEPVEIPGKIEAENYSDMKGIQKEETSDTGGGKNIGWIDNGDWTEYVIDVPVSGDYRMDLRVAAEGNETKNVQILSDGEILGDLRFQATGDWQEWDTVSTVVSLAQGEQTLKVSFQSSGLNLNWIQFVEDDGSDLTEPEIVDALPLRLEAEGYSSMSGIQTESCSEGGENIGWTDSGDWMDFPINLAAGGLYDLEFRVAGNGGSIELLTDDSSLASFAVLSTGGWQNWASHTQEVELPEGVQILRVRVEEGGFNLNWLEISEPQDDPNDTGDDVEPDDPAGSFELLLEAENFFTMSGIATESCSEGGENIGWIDGGDWVNFIIEIPETGTYTVEYRVASEKGNAHFRLDTDDGNTLLDDQIVSATGGWQEWTTLTGTAELQAGPMTIGIYAFSGGFNMNWIRISR